MDIFGRERGQGIILSITGTKNKRVAIIKNYFIEHLKCWLMSKDDQVLKILKQGMGKHF